MLVRTCATSGLVTDLPSGCPVQGNSRAFGGNSRRVSDDASHIPDTEGLVPISDEGMDPTLPLHPDRAN